MLKHGLALTVLALAGVAAVPDRADAQVVVTGTLHMRQTTDVACSVTLYAIVAPSGATAVVTGGSFSAGNWQCGWLVTPSGFPWNATITGPGTINVSGVSATTILGSCSGSFTSNGLTSSSLVIPSTAPATLPGTPNACTFWGTLNF
ncbi:protein activator of alkane oxidation PraB [Caulobacter flavus]|uniref:Protein activator of alkane oxidation PraB n=1 Tax=Caulobacter flavus TaxID=1679497 RepID=A0A2N5CU39_9CAUL|nr:protein activator of alkane oxidation PraB [Caulobacter flavus]AYV48014.1 protein activator of alkane oxidation PraB [Caulobacter flavus]PLR16278.1 protein activator of alkane oxidation PraB [Caulobacter flavus]